VKAFNKNKGRKKKVKMNVLFVKVCECEVLCSYQTLMDSASDVEFADFNVMP
jgi:hypothetical protein